MDDTGTALAYSNVLFEETIPTGGIADPPGMPAVDDYVVVYDIAASLVCMTGGEYQLTLTAGPDVLFSGLRSGMLGLDGLTFANTCTTSASPPNAGCPSFPGPIPCCLIVNTATITVHA